MNAVDWDKGLPLDVLALVAKAGGVSEMTAMLAVSKTWQQAFGLTTTAINIRQINQVQPFSIEAAELHQGLTRVSIDSSVASRAWLDSLRLFPKLNSLSLGEQTLWLRPGAPASRLTDADLWHLRGLQLAMLDLSGCRRVTANLMALRGMPLTCLDLKGCKLSGAKLGPLQGLPLTRLNLSIYSLPSSYKSLERRPWREPPENPWVLLHNFLPGMPLLSSGQECILLGMFSFRTVQLLPYITDWKIFVYFLAP